ncbi:MAG: protein kinase [Verrucomicrobiae bacterium]|nr:protein kinase [Verrucomicrobiae bacterium]
MNTEEENRPNGGTALRCQECGESIPADAPEGVCPQCVLLQGISELPGSGSPSSLTSKTIDAADVAAAFPKLEGLVKVGGGGMGTVFRARQPGLDRTVALKILTAGSPSPEFHERFLREARAMARLSHPDIVTIHEFGESDGYYYFIMEFVEGQSLAARLQDGPIESEEAKRILGTVARALEFAHGKGIVHRDIKPGNILLGKDGSVKVADFGLAKLVRSDSAADGFSLTMENQTIGTPFYMAPEQRTCAAKVDQRADVYALGVVLYEMLTGKPPELDYQPPSETLGVSHEFNTLVRAATASDPEKRIASAAAFDTQLQSITEMNEEPSPESPQPKRRWGLFTVFKRRWWAFLVGGLLGAPTLGLATAAVVTYLMPREYLGRLRLQIQPVSQDFEVFRDKSSRTMITPAYIQTQFQIITSKETLYDVIDELQLVRKWEDARTPAEAYAKLLKMVETEAVRGTDLIDIEVYHTDPQEAADIANAIAVTYRNRRTEMESARSKQALDILNAQETLQEQKVEDTRLRMIALMEKFNIIDLGDGMPDWAGVGDTSETASKQLVQASKLSALQAEQEISTIRTHIQTLNGLEGERLFEEVVALNLMDSTISVFFPERQKLKAQLKALLDTGLGPEHPDIQSVESQLDNVNRILESGASSVKSSLQTRLKIAENSLKNLEELEVDKKEETMDERKKFTQYVEAKRAYETQNLILTDMRQGLLKEKVDLSLPKNPIIVHEIAEPDEMPVRPRGALNLLVGFFGGGILLFVPIGIVAMYLVHAVLRP